MKLQQCRKVKDFLKSGSVCSIHGVGGNFICSMNFLAKNVILIYFSPQKSAIQKTLRFHSLCACVTLYLEILQFSDFPIHKCN